MVARETSTRETVVQALFHLKRITTVLSRTLEHSAGNVDEAPGSSDSRNAISHRLSEGQNFENKRRKNFEGAE